MYKNRRLFGGLDVDMRTGRNGLKLGFQLGFFKEHRLAFIDFYFLVFSICFDFDWSEKETAPSLN